MTPSEQARYKEATATFRAASKLSNQALHRTLNRPPKGNGWVQCYDAPAGLMCRPEKLRQAIVLFRKAYDTFPNIVALNQVALGHEMLGEMTVALACFQQMREQAIGAGNAAYQSAAEMGIARVSAAPASAAEP